LSESPLTPVIFCVAAIFLLWAGSALGEATTVIACTGVEVTDSGGGGPQTLYYKISSTWLAKWDDHKSQWEQNLCSQHEYSCFLNDRKYYASGHYNNDAGKKIDHSLDIDRLSGSVSEFWRISGGGSLLFDGKCTLAVDPSTGSSPTKF
jgi:hypothetical protein